MSSILNMFILYCLKTHNIQQNTITVCSGIHQSSIYLFIWLFTRTFSYFPVYDILTSAKQTYQTVPDVACVQNRPKYRSNLQSSKILLTDFRIVLFGRLHKHSACQVNMKPIEWHDNPFSAIHVRWHWGMKMALQNSRDAPDVVRIRDSGQYALESKLLRCAFVYYLTLKTLN